MIPMTRTTLLMPAPLAQRPALPSLMGEIVASLTLSTIDPAIAVMVLLACISLVTQGVADIAWPNGMVMPLGTSCFVVAPSGTGKTLVLRLLTEPIQRFISELRLSPREGKREPMFLMDDSSRAAIVRHVAAWPIAGLLTDEAGQLEDLLRNAAATLAKLSDGTPFYHSRVGSERVESRFHRFVMLLMEQPSVFAATKSLLGASKGSVGLFNRYQVGITTNPPASTAVSSLGISQEVKARYERTVRELLARAIEMVDNDITRPTLRLSMSAAARLAEIAQEMRSLADHNPRYAEITEYLSRHAERTLRAAGAIHVFNHGIEGEVQLASLEAAHGIGLQSIEAYLSLVRPPRKPTQAEEDAGAIETALVGSACFNGPWFLLSNLRRTCANVGLTKARFDRALPLLAGRGKVTIGVHQRQDWVYLNPSPPCPSLQPH